MTIKHFRGGRLVTQALSVLLIGTIATLASCGSPPKITQNTVELQERAGSVGIAVLSVTDWETYKKALTPDFKLDAEAALNEVLPETAQISQKIRDEMAFRAALSLPTVSGTTTTALNADGTTQTTGSQTKESGAVPSAAPTPLFNNNDWTKLAGLAAPTGASALKNDPMLKYRAATALFQEVAMLERYIEDANIRADHDAFVVRVQISVMPRQRNMPYDIYTTLSFIQRDHDVSPQFRQLMFDLGLPAAESDDDAAIHIIPMLVTDNIEGIARSRSTDTIRALALAASGSIPGGIGANAAFDQRLAWLEEVFSRDLNSLMTVGRVNDNSICVRLGARQIGPREFAQVPQTHDITLMMFVPRRSGISQAILQIDEGLFEARRKLNNANQPVTEIMDDLKKLQKSLDRTQQQVDRDKQAKSGGVGIQATDMDANLQAAQEQVDTKKQASAAATATAETERAEARKMIRELTARKDKLIYVVNSRAGQEIGVAARNEFRHARTGISLVLPNREDFMNRARLIFKRYLSEGHSLDFTVVTPAKLNQIIDAVTNNDFAEFRTALGNSWKEYEPFVWADLVAAHDGNRFSYAQFEIPEARIPVLPDEELGAAGDLLLLDDGKDRTRTVMRGGSHLAADQMVATLNILESADNGPGKPIARLAADSITVDPTGTTATIDFPSLKAWGFQIDKSNSFNVNITLRDGRDCTFNVAAYRTAQPPAFVSPLKITGLPAWITADKNKGTLHLLVERNASAHESLGADKPLGIRIDGASVLKASPINAKANMVTLSLTDLANKPMLDIDLDNLVKDSKVVVTVLLNGKPLEAKEEFLVK